MNKPSDNRRAARSRRAEPLQPDAPGRGQATESAPPEGSLGGDSGVAAIESDAVAQKLSETRAKKQKEQSQAALDNVREGYD